MSHFAELFGQVVSSLLRNKLRSFLTMAGIAWGVASIVLIVAMGDGFKQGQRNNMKQLGENIVLVFGGRTEMQVGGQRAGRRVRLTYDDIRDIRAECWLVKHVVGEMQNGVRAVSPYNSGSFSVNGVEPLYSQIRTIPVAEGRFLVEEDSREGRRSAVLGDNVRKQLFGERPGALASQIAINGLPFTVVGLMPAKTQNSSYNGLDSEKLYIPYSTMVRDVPPAKDLNFRPGIVNNIIYVPSSLTEWKAARDQVLRVLGRNHGFDPLDRGAVHIWDTVESAELVDGLFVSMTAFLASIAVVTLTLGGVGVMNIMLVTVTERTREIGLRKAVGATRRRILADFLLEGVLLGGVSGMVGFLGAYGLAAVVNSFPKPEMFGGLPVDGATTAWAFGALGLVAVASAVWPAWRAASLTPVEALRYER
ncbi:MAG TPA: ABC transporter permease [Bryobacteraceae bacterium]|nr:ABC transporter permease [Bryobacteraceae bacterium]